MTGSDILQCPVYPYAPWNARAYGFPLLHLHIVCDVWPELFVYIFHALWECPRWFLLDECEEPQGSVPLLQVGSTEVQFFDLVLDALGGTRWRP